jgi:hypothetical protein
VRVTFPEGLNPALSSGGVGQIYRGRDGRLNRTAAVDVFHRGGAQSLYASLHSVRAISSLQRRRPVDEHGHRLRIVPVVDRVDHEPLAIRGDRIIVSWSGG